MSVEKIDFSYVSQEKKTFTTHLNSVLQNLRNPEALGIWAYLSSLPEGWIVNKEHLRKHFNVGRDKLDTILKYLVDNCLLDVGQERLNDGKMGKGYIYVRCGYDFQQDCKIKEQSYPQKTPLTEKPDTAKPGHGKSAPINNIKSFNKINKSRESAERKKRVPLSDDFVFDDENQKLCQEKKLDPKFVLDKFKAHSKLKSRKEADWQAVAKLWIMREQPANVANPANVKNEIKSTVMEYGPGHPRWEELHGKNGIMNKENTHGSGISRDRARC